jgi:hypothetical protein
LHRLALPPKTLDVVGFKQRSGPWLGWFWRCEIQAVKRGLARSKTLFRRCSRANRIAENSTTQLPSQPITAHHSDLSTQK